jgi:hypothetical protein
MSKENEKSRHVERKLDKSRGSQKRKNVEKSSQPRDNDQSVEPKNPDVGDLEHDR